MSRYEVSLTGSEARALVKVLAKNNSPKLSRLLEQVQRLLRVDDARPKAPWRKVVKRVPAGATWAEELDCGHTRLLRSSKNKIEAFAERRRCEKCLPSGRDSKAAKAARGALVRAVP